MPKADHLEHMKFQLWCKRGSLEKQTERGMGTSSLTSTGFVDPVSLPTDGWQVVNDSLLYFKGRILHVYVSFKLPGGVLRIGENNGGYLEYTTDNCSTKGKKEIDKHTQKEMPRGAQRAQQLKHWCFLLRGGGDRLL